MATQSTETFHVKVRFTEQQIILLDKLIAEGSFGATYSEVVARVFAEHLRNAKHEDGTK